MKQLPLPNTDQPYLPHDLASIRIKNLLAITKGKLNDKPTIHRPAILNGSDRSNATQSANDGRGGDRTNHAA